MGRKNIYMDRSNKIDLPVGGNSGFDKTKRFGSNHWVYFPDNTRIYSKQMGEITLKVVNYVGLIGVVFGFLSNLNNIISVFLGIGSLMFLVFKGLKERENWLYRKAERKQKELQNMKEEDSYIRDRS